MSHSREPSERLPNDVVAQASPLESDDSDSHRSVPNEDAPTALPRRIASLEEIARLEQQAADEEGADQENEDNVSRHNETVLDSGPNMNTCERCHHCGGNSTLGKRSIRSDHSGYKSDLLMSPMTTDSLATATTNLSKEMVLASEMIPDKPMPQPELPSRRRMKKRGRNNDSVYKLYMFRWLELTLRRALWLLGKWIGCYSSILMIIPLLIFIICTIGLIVNRASLTYTPQLDTMYLSGSHLSDKLGRTLTTEHGRPMFNYSNPAFNAIDRRSPGDFSVILKVARHGKTILESENTDAYDELRARVQKISVGNEQTRAWHYGDLCRSSCEDVLSMLTQSASAVTLTFPETFLDYVNGTVRRMYLGATFGGVETNPQGGIARARAMAMYYRLREPKVENEYDAINWSNYEPIDESEIETESMTLAQTHPRLSEWAQKYETMLNEATEEPQFQRLQLSWWSYQGFLAAVSSGFQSVYMCMAFSLGIVLIGALCACATKDSYSSKPGAAVMITLIIVLSTIGGLSLEFGCSGRFEPTIIGAYFYVTALGLLLTLSGVHAWHKYNNVAVDPVEKTMFVLSWDGPCVVAVCGTAIVCYAITGVVTSLEFYRHACFVVAACVTLLLIMILMVHFVMVHITGKREAAGLKWFQFWKKGDTNFTERVSGEEYHEKELDGLHHKLCDQAPNLFRQFGSGVATVHFRFMTILVVSIYLIFAIWGCTQVTVEFKEDSLLPSSSKPQQFLDDYRSFYGRNEEYVELIFDDVLDYMNPNTRAAIFNLIEWAQKEKYATRAVSWLADFVGFNRTTRYEVRQDTFVAVVYRVFLRSSRYEAYTADIAFAPLHTQIVASRMYLQLSQKAKSNQLALISGLLAMARTHELPLRIRAPSVFLLPHDVQIRTITAIAVTMAMCLMSFGTLLTVAEPFSALMVLVASLSTAVGTVGIGSLWGVPFNAPLAFTVLAGLMYTAGVSLMFCYHFINAGSISQTAQQRMEYAFHTVSSPALWSAVITMLSFLPLLAIGTPLMSHMARLFALQLLISLAHVVFIVAPAMLLVTEHVPKGCGFVRSCTEETCCACCDLEEDAASIYYIPTTTARSLDHETLQRCLRQNYGDNVHVLAPLEVPHGPRPMAIMPPPPGSESGLGPVVTEPDVIIGYGRIRRGRRGRSGAYRSNSSMTGGSRGRRKRMTSESSNATTKDGSPTPPPRTDSSSLRHKPKAQQRSHSHHRGGSDYDETASLPDDAIYEEPPPLPEPNPHPSMRNGTGTTRSAHAIRTSEHRNSYHQRSHHGGGGSMAVRPTHRRPTLHGDELRYTGATSNGSMELRSNWRQYMLDGNVRRHSVVEVPPLPVLGMVPGGSGAPQIIALGPPPQQGSGPPPAFGQPPRYRPRY